MHNLCVCGSRARGDAAPDSEIFIKLAPCSPELRERISELTWEVSFKKSRVISTLVTTTDDGVWRLEHGAMGANPVWFNIQREGMTV